jgi:hypothetical protein
MWTLRCGEHNNRRRHYYDPKGPGVEASGSGMRDVQLMPPFQAPNNIFRYTTEEPHGVTAQHATSDEAAKLCPAPCSRKATPSSGKEASSDIAIQDIEVGTKGDKKRHKQYL